MIYILIGMILGYFLSQKKVKGAVLGGLAGFGLSLVSGIIFSLILMAIFVLLVIFIYKMVKEKK